MKISLDFLSLGAVAVIVGIVILAVRQIQSKIDRTRYLEELAELEFEQSVLGMNSSALTTNQNLSADYVFQTPVESVPPPTPTITPLFQSPSNVSQFTNLTEGALAADVLGRSVIDKLETAGMLRNIDGYQELHGNPKGVAILRLRNGKTALLVPHLESEAFLQRNAKRADFIIQCDTRGNAYVVRPMADFITENISGL